MGLLPQPLPLSGGEILLGGERISGAGAARLRALRGARMSMIFQEPITALNPVMRCGQQIDEVLQEHTRLNPAARLARTVEIIREVALPEPQRMLEAYPHQLSG